MSYSSAFGTNKILGGDLRGFVSQTVQTQLQMDDITIQECTELDIDNEIIRDKNESLQSIKKVPNSSFASSSILKPLFQGT